jgi:Family of unknown function (DUF6675)
MELSSLSVRIPAVAGQFCPWRLKVLYSGNAMKQPRYSIFGVPILMALVSRSSHALTLDELRAVEPNLTNEQAQTLLGRGSVTRYFDGHEPAAFAPECSRSPSIEADISSFDYTTGVETLCFAKEGGGDDAAAMFVWYNALRSISAFQGVKYYDLSSGTMQTLFQPIVCGR